MPPTATERAPMPNTSLTRAPGSTRGDGTTNSMLTAALIAGSLPPSVTDWTPGRAVTDCSRQRVEAALARAVEALAPIDPMRLGEGLRTLMHVWPAPSSWNAEVAMRAYVEVFADLPPDLFAIARAHALRHCKRLPSPADILDPVNAELARRQNLVAQLRWVLGGAKFETPKRPSKEEREKVAALLAGLARSLEAPTKKRTRAPRYVEMTAEQRARLLDKMSPA